MRPIRWWHRQVGHPVSRVWESINRPGWYCTTCDTHLGTSTVTVGSRVRPQRSSSRG